MANRSDFQRALFESISSRLPSHLSLVDEISELLDVSADSAYRRIRGDKVLSLDEAEKLSQHFNVSLDNLMGIVSDSVTFKSVTLDEESFSFTDYMRWILADMESMTGNEPVVLIFQLNELNLFHAIQFPEILAFKLYFWSKSHLDFKSLRNIKYTLTVFDDEASELSSRITDNYIKINTIEIQTPEFMNSFLKQIDYYWASGFFENREDVTSLCNKALELIEHLRYQAELGFKFVPGCEPSGQEGNFQLYNNSIALIDNVILLNMGDKGMTYISNGAINLLYTTNQDFYLRNLKTVNAILRKSTLISGYAERERNCFFNNIRDRIIQVRDNLPTL